MKAAATSIAATAKPPSRMFLFARNFVRHPRMLGTPLLSPRPMIEELLNRVNWRDARVVVEYGPGVGNITAEILRRLHPEATLVVIETNREFADYLRVTLHDHRLSVIHGSAAEVRVRLAILGASEPDHVISGIPFSTMPGTLREGILRATHSVLQPGGAFLAYQYSRQVVPGLKRIFGEVRQDFLLFNLVPTWLFQCLR